MKICYIILTCEKYIPTRVEWQLSSFFQNIDKKNVYYLSCKNSREYIYGWNTDDSYEGCPIKYIEFFRNMILDYDWYVFIDDDTFINTKKLEKFVMNFNPSLSFYMGCFTNDKEFGLEYRKAYSNDKGNYIKYNNEHHNFYSCSGGAGIIMSNNIYKQLIDYVRNTPIENLYFNHNGDVTLAHWVTKLNDINYIQVNTLYTDKHKNQEELQNFISFHYLKTQEDFEYYNNITKNI
jgi:hypothetical protein